MVGEGSFPCTSNVFFSIDANLPSMLSRVGRSGQVQRSKDEGAAPVCGNKHLGVYHAERALSVALKAEGRNAFRWMGTVSCTLVDIRPAREEDAPALARLYVEAFGSKLRWAFGKYEDALPAVVEQLLRHDQMRWSETLVAEVDGQVAGMAVLRRDHTHRPRWNLVWHLTRRHVRGWRV
ncbi:MAG: hypothetical protein NZ741_13010, partial [Armatimonadetes bacterium]|nr:hypothetical protein [Armatimonadota bacterium]